MADTIDMTGQLVGPWTVICKADRPANLSCQGQYFRCRCRCGAEETIPGSRLRAGRYGRGCRFCRPYGRRDGKETGSHRSWRAMRDRCYNSKAPGFDRYGGRGITVCERWRYSFEAFLADMGERPEGHTLDRIDSSGNYEPSNCRWATAKQQAHNSSTTRLSDEQVAAIIRLLGSGAKQIDIAEACGVTRSHIANIATGRSARGIESEARHPEKFDV